MSKLKALAGQTVVYGVSTILVRALNWMLAPLLTYVLIESEFGVMSDLYAYVAFINVIFMYGMETAFFRFAGKRKEEANKVFSTALASLLISSSFGLIFFSLFAKRIAQFMWNNDSSEFVLIFLFIIFLDTLANIPFAKLRLDGKPLKYVGIKGLNVVVNLTVNFLLLYPIFTGDLSMFGYTVDPALKLHYVFIANLAASIVTLIALSPTIFKPKFEFCKETWASMMKYGLPFVIVGLAGMANETLDKILLKWLLPQPTLVERLAQLGIYSAAYKLSIFMALIVQGFKLGVEPFFFKNSSAKDAKETYSKIMTYFIILALTMFLGVSLNLDWIILVLSDNFRAGMSIVPIVLMAYVFLGIFYNLSVWYKLTDKTNYAMIIAIVGAGVTIGLNIWLIPEIGYMGSAWATFAAYFSMTLISYFWGQNHYPIQYKLIKIGLYFILAIGLFVISQYITFDKAIINFLLKNLLILLFVIIAYISDGRSLMIKKISKE